VAVTGQILVLTSTGAPLVRAATCRRFLMPITGKLKSTQVVPVERGAAIWAAEIHTLFRTGTHDSGGRSGSWSDEIIDLSVRQMAKAREDEKLRALEQIVDAYVRLKDGRALLDLRAHRQRLIVDLTKLRSNSNCNVSLALGKMTEDLAIIDVVGSLASGTAGD
jgi:hypothetical protein